MNTPDELAWTLFIQVNADAKSSGNNNALFETWASDSDTFKSTPQWPGASPQLALRPPVIPVQIPQSLRARGLAPQVPPRPPSARGGEETRRNRAAFDYIVQNNLYKVSGLQAAFGRPIVFPIDSVEVKANWFPVADPTDPTRSGIPGYDGSPADADKVYHVNTGTDGKKYALVSMHVISKLVPNWTWATFEHKNNLGRCDIIGCKDGFGAQQAFVPPNAQAGQIYPDCTKTDALKKMISAAKWDPAFVNYCLKGSQTDFTDATGLAIRLGNSVTEAGFVNQASCMTCHGRAAFDQTGHATTIGGFDPVSGNAPIGPVDPTWYSAVNGPPYFPMFENMPNLSQVAQQADFVWSIPFCAIDDTANPPQTTSRFCGGK